MHHLLSNMASKKDEKTFKALMKNIKYRMPPRSMKTCRRFFKARVKICVLAIVQSNMHIDNVWARWSDTYDAIALRQEVTKVRRKYPDASIAEQARKETFIATSIMKEAFPIHYCPQCGVKLCSPPAIWIHFCTHCGVKFPQKHHLSCNRCGCFKVDKI